MTGFDDALRRLAAELDLPEPVRSRTLLELRGDLEDMAGALMARGVGEAEARGRAAEVLLPTAEALADLRRLHRPLYQRLVDRFSARGRNRLESGFLVAVAGIYVVAGAVTLSRFHLSPSSTPGLWPVLILSALVAVTGVGKLLQLFVVGAHGSALRRGLKALLGLGGATLVAAGFALVADLYGVAGRLSLNPEGQLRELLAWLRRDAALLAVALLVASAAGLIWLVAAVRIARSEQAEAAALGLTTTGRTE